MGFGHRVYKNFDPRAEVMKQTADEVLAELGIKDDPLLEIAKRLEEIALSMNISSKRNFIPMSTSTLALFSKRLAYRQACSRSFLPWDEPLDGSLTGMR